MTQRQIPHQVTLLPCVEGHAARHYLDHRATRAGGGHFIECPCRCTGKHETIDGALDEWFRLNQKRRPRAARPAVGSPATAIADVLQFPLPLLGGRRA
jgi:hypothetical protein